MSQRCHTFAARGRRACRSTRCRSLRAKPRGPLEICCRVIARMAAYPCDYPSRKDGVQKPMESISGRCRTPSNSMRGTACLRVITSGFCAQIRGIPPGSCRVLPPPPPRPPHEVPRGDDNARSSMDFFRKKHRKPGILHWQNRAWRVENLDKVRCTSLYRPRKMRNPTRTSDVRFVGQLGATGFARTLPRALGSTRRS